MFAVNTLNLLFISFAEKYATKVGVLDNSIQELNVGLVDLESKIALFRSTTFLVDRYKNDYQTHPEKVIYIQPVKDGQGYYSYNQY